MKKTGRAEIPHREWLELEIDVDEKNLVKSAGFRSWGCRELLKSAGRAVDSFKGRSLDALSWPGVNHWDLLIAEALERLKGKFKLPVDDPETCHCRRIPTARVDEAIVLGAHTPEKVSAWTSASTGCGTCRPVVELIIAYRLKTGLKKAG